MPFLIFPMVMWMVILVGGFTLASRLIRALENRNSGSGTSEIAALQERIARLEEALESVNTHVGRLEDGQQFAMQLLERRTGESEDASSTDQRTDTN